MQCMSVDLYCERIGPGLWAEPVNAVTNLAFLCAAWAAWNLARRRQVHSSATSVLIGLCTIIGIGSGLFHTFATDWAQLLDVTPILLFQVGYVWVYGRQIMGIPRFHAAGILAGYLGAGFWAWEFSHVWNGSVMYLPALGLLLIMGTYHRLTHRIEPWILLVATGVFVLSLICRTMDQVICLDFPLGTHFLWHIFNGVLLYLLLRGLIVNLDDARADPCGQEG